jgi:AraC-like DNA-binding protein
MSKRGQANELYQIAKLLTFQPHRISVDPTGRYDEPLDREFPFFIRLFHFHQRDFTPVPSWHESLELFVPLDGPVCMRMGNRYAKLGAGEILIVDNLRLHMVADSPDLNTRVIVISFLPEFVWDGGAHSQSHIFLSPFYKKSDRDVSVVRQDATLFVHLHHALARLLACYFNRTSYFQAGCKVYLHQLLYYLAQHFGAAESPRSELIRKQDDAMQLKPVFRFLSDNYAQPVTLSQGASMAKLRAPQFMKLFKKVAGTTFVSYVTLIRLANAVPLLKETSLSIKDVAKQVGFADQSYFDRRFKSTFDRTPRAFRQKFSNGEKS